MRRIAPHWTATLGFLLGAVVFLGAGVSKLWQFPTFVEQIADYRLLPPGTGDWVALAVVSLELAIGVGLLISPLRRACAAAGIALLGGFCLLMGVSLVNRLEIDCGCFLPIGLPPQVGPLLLLRNGLLMLPLAWALYLTAPHRPAPRRLLRAAYERRLRILGALACGLLLFQSLQTTQANYLLRDEVDRLTNRPPLVVGDRAPALDLVTPRGEPLGLDFAAHASSTLILFSTECPYCEASLPRWNQRHAQARTEEVVLGISIDGAEETRAYLATHDVAFPVALPRDVERFSEAYRVYDVPQVLEVDRAGRLTQVTRGFEPPTPPTTETLASTGELQSAAHP